MTSAVDEVELENAPFLAQDSLSPSQEWEEVLGNEDVDNGVWTLLVQHFSNAWGTRMAEFAMHLYLIVYFQDTLLPNALYGFSACIVNIVLAEWLGSLVDRVPKLRLVRLCILCQKLSAFAGYVTFCFMFRLGPAPVHISIFSSILPLATIVLSGSVLQASNTCVTIAVERDWVTCIASGSSDRLTKLNAQMKRIDLVCKLLAPLFVSLLSTFMPYLWAATIMSLIQLVTLTTELFWVKVVYRKCTALPRDQAKKDARTETNDVDNSSLTEEPTCGMGAGSDCSPGNSRKHWSEFSQLPIFLSSLSASFLYMTVLSFDGTMLSYLKTEGYSDATLSIMRGVNVLTGLGGTALAPWLERRLGSVRGGSWSIWFEVVCLVPVVLALESSWSKRDIGVAAFLFGGMALSRIGLWSFDLIQTKQLQVSLEEHPERNTLTSLQFSLQNSADLIKYLLTMVFYKPSEFKWTALLSFVSVLSGATTYTFYVKQERGHLFHIDWLSRKPRS